MILGFSTINVSATTKNNEELIVCNATLEEDFLDDSIIVVLKHDVSLMFKTYLCNDFDEINCINVDDLTENSINLLKKQIMAEQTGDWSSLTKHIENHMLMNIDSFHQILCLTIGNPGKENVIKSIRELEKRNDIYSAEPDYIEKLDSSVDDTYFLDSQRGLNKEYGINVNKAWNITTGNKKILVDIIDSGIDGHHPDLINNINEDLHRDYVDTPYLSDVRVVDKEDLKDPCGHGTHVAGIVGAQANNEIGISGVAQNVSLFSLRVFNEYCLGNADDVEKAVDFATTEDIPILNYSGGGSQDHCGRKRAIENYPGLFVCAAGNSGEDNDLNDVFPSNYNFDNLISVGAISVNEKNDKSNFGAKNVDIFAPGKSIISTYPTDLYNPNVEVGHIAVGYRELSGTSMATPFVTGVAALMLSVNPNITPQQIKFTIMNNATKYSALDNLCVSGGRLDAFKSVSAVAFTVNDNIKINGLIPEYSMKKCTDLEIPESFAQISSEYGTPIQKVSIIGSAAFRDMENLKSIVLPSNVEYIDNEAFRNCSSLTSVVVNRAITGITNLGENVFAGCNSNLLITVPTNRIIDYKNKESWSLYRNKIVPSEDYSEIDMDCESNLSYSLSLDKATNKLYKLNANCSKSYKINVNSSNQVNIVIYDSDMNVLYSESNSLTKFFGFGTYYVSFEFNNVTASGMFDIGISLTYISTDIVLRNGVNDIKSSMHLNNNNLYHCNYKYLNNIGFGFYKLSLNAGSDVFYPTESIKIYTDQNRTLLLNRYGATEIINQAILCNGENELYVFFPENDYYYIEITLPNLSYSSVTLTIEKVETHNLIYDNNIDKTRSDELFTYKTSNSYFEDVTISHHSKMELEIMTRDIVDEDIPVYIFEKYCDPGYEQGINHYYLNLKYANFITRANIEPVFTVILNPGTYYFGYSDNTNNVGVQFTLIRKVNTDSNMDRTLVADPTDNAGFTIGSEVTLNNGKFSGNTITEGFTRCIYLMVEDKVHDPLSRLKYDWYSNDESVAIVTAYGTVIAQSVDVDTEVTIYAVLKEDPSVMYRKTFIILNDIKTYETNPLDYYLTMIIEAGNVEQIDLSNLNVPIDMTQYYNWSRSSLLNIDYWGYMCAEPTAQGMSFEVVGTYRLNPRVIIHMKVYVI